MFGQVRKLLYLCNVKSNKRYKYMEVIAYKGMESNMTCRDFQYEIGKTYKTDKAKLCECGFHACLNPRDVLGYYPQYESSRYFKVKLSGKITKCDKSDTKVAATEITILEEININEIIKTTEWWKNNNVLDLLRWSEGFARVQRGVNLWNFIDKKGNILFKQWFIWLDDFHEGFARVRKEDYLCNFIDANGNMLFDKWFNWVGDFHNGFARVQRKDYLYNFINKDGKLLSDEWFIDVCDFNDGFAIVERSDDLYNFIDKKGNYLSNEWFKWSDDFHEGFAKVQRENGLCNFIDKQGNILSNEWFIEAYSFVDGFANVYRTNGEYCKIDKSGKLLES